jgi:hypothetical protein
VNLFMVNLKFPRERRGGLGLGNMKKVTLEKRKGKLEKRRRKPFGRRELQSH